MIFLLVLGSVAVQLSAGQVAGIPANRKDVPVGEADFFCVVGAVPAKPGAAPQKRSEVVAQLRRQGYVLIRGKTADFALAPAVAEPLLARRLASLAQWVDDGGKPRVLSVGSSSPDQRALIQEVLQQGPSMAVAGLATDPRLRVVVAPAARLVLVQDGRSITLLLQPAEPTSVADKAVSQIESTDPLGKSAGVNEFPESLTFAFHGFGRQFDLQRKIVDEGYALVAARLQRESDAAKSRLSRAIAQRLGYSSETPRTYGDLPEDLRNLAQKALQQQSITSGPDTGLESVKIASLEWTLSVFVWRPNGTGRSGSGFLLSRIRY